MKLLDDYFALQQQILDYFGYVEDWVAIPLDDGRAFFWHLRGEGPGTLEFADGALKLGTGEGYEHEIYTQRFLPKWVYRGADYTMVCVDTRTDGNKFLMVLDNAKEVKQVAEF